MIVGNGDIASALEGLDRPDYTFFASGVSNSQEIRESEYQREVDLLLSQPRDSRLVYFGSLSIFYNEGRYVDHKMLMEELVKDEFSMHTIMRVGTITWGSNPNTIINFLRNRMKEREPIEIRETTRYIMDRKEFRHWIKLIPDWNCQMNLTGHPMSVEEIVKEYVL